MDQHERGAAAQLTLLARVGAILGSGLRRQETLERVADLLVPALRGLVRDRPRRRRRRAPAQRLQPESFPSPPSDAPHGPAIVLRTGEPELVREITEDHLFVVARGDWAEMRGDAQVQRHARRCACR